jgi:hypothetical protein
MSPVPGFSTWTTSAPKSASNVPASGPATMCANSTTFNPSNSGRLRS